MKLAMPRGSTGGGLRGGGADDSPPSAVDQQGAHVGGVEAVAEGGVRRERDGGVLLDGLRLAGEGGFLDAKGDRFPPAGGRPRTARAVGEAIRLRAAIALLARAS